MGYVEETGVAQHYRDIRIAPIYEGTNGIQAIDLVGRKLGLRDGAAIAELIDGIDATAAEARVAGGEPALLGERLAEASGGVANGDGVVAATRSSRSQQRSRRGDAVPAHDWRRDGRVAAHQVGTGRRRRCARPAGAASRRSSSSRSS